MVSQTFGICFHVCMLFENPKKTHRKYELKNRVHISNGKRIALYFYSTNNKRKNEEAKNGCWVTVYSWKSNKFRIIWCLCAQKKCCTIHFKWNSVKKCFQIFNARIPFNGTVFPPNFIACKSNVVKCMGRFIIAQWHYSILHVCCTVNDQVIFFGDTCDNMLCEWEIKKRKHTHIYVTLVIFLWINTKHNLLYACYISH